MMAPNTVCAGVTCTCPQNTSCVPCTTIVAFLFADKTREKIAIRADPFVLHKGLAAEKGHAYISSCQDAQYIAAVKEDQPEVCHCILQIYTPQPRHVRALALAVEAKRGRQSFCKHSAQQGTAAATCDPCRYCRRIESGG